MASLLRRLLMIEEHVCPWWVGYTLDNPLRRFVHDPKKILAGLVGEGQTVMDLGCGMGYFSLAMARMVGRTGKVISVDIEPRMLRRLERRETFCGPEPRRASACDGADGFDTGRESRFARRTLDRRLGAHPTSAASLMAARYRALGVPGADRL
jgi:SAM-dependent methyltransferase